MTDLNKSISGICWSGWMQILHKRFLCSPTPILNEAVLHAIFLSTSSPLASESQALQEQSSYVLRLPGMAARSTVTWPLKANDWVDHSNLWTSLRTDYCLCCVIIYLPYSLSYVDRVQLRWLFLNQLAQPMEQMGKEREKNFFFTYILGSNSSLFYSYTSSECWGFLYFFSGRHVRK